MARRLAAGRAGADNGCVARLADEDVEAGLARLPGWERAGDSIRRVYELPSFPDAVAFVQRVADAAEAADHHPDIDIRYRRVVLVLTTHSEGGLTAKDLALAADADAALPPVGT